LDFSAPEKSSFQVMIAPLAPTLPPIKGGGALRCPGITETGNFPAIAFREYGSIATGGCNSGGGMLACPQERQNYSKDFSRAHHSFLVP